MISKSHERFGGPGSAVFLDVSSDFMGFHFIIPGTNLYLMHFYLCYDIHNEKAYTSVSITFLSNFSQKTNTLLVN